MNHPPLPAKPREDLDGRRWWYRNMTVKQNLSRLCWIVRNNMRAGDWPWK